MDQEIATLKLNINQLAGISRLAITALLYIEVDSSQFNGSAPKVTCKIKGKLIKVPDNYDPTTRIITVLSQYLWSDVFNFLRGKTPEAGRLQFRQE